MPTWTKASFEETILGFLWSQWTQIGLSGISNRSDRWVIDPEALCLLTLRFRHEEPRLYRETLDWLRENGRLVSVRRLRSLAREKASRQVIDAALAWAGLHNASLQNWATPIRKGRPPNDRVRVDDQSDAEAGLELFREDWPTTTPSGNSVPPNPTSSPCLAFRLRLLFGVGSRAEVICYLLTTDRPESTTTEVAHSAAFGKWIVNQALSELAEADAVRSRPGGRGVLYSLDGSRWASLLGTPTSSLPRRVDWIRLFSSVWAIDEWLREDEGSDRTPYLRASEARVLVERIRPDLLAAGADVPEGRGVHGEAYWQVFQATVDATLQMLKPAS